jgi:excisionase family DNA binding protein
MTVEQHLRIDELSERLHVHPATVRRWIADGERTRGRRGLYPVRRLGRRCVLVPASAVQRLLEAS